MIWKLELVGEEIVREGWDVKSLQALRAFTWPRLHQFDRDFERERERDSRKN